MLAIKEAARALAEATKEGLPVAALTGAGISAESGIPTFRGQAGLWKGFRPEELATPQAFQRDPERVWEWYHWRRRLVTEAQPNPGHYALAALEHFVKEHHHKDDLVTVITQNVDGLHRRAGSASVIEIHGTLLDARCTRCPHVESIPPDASGLMYCSACGALSRPAVVWFGESLPPDAWHEAYRRSMAAAVMLVVGTSAVVHPAAGLIELAAQGGAVIIEINPEPSGMAGWAQYAIRAKAGEALPQLLAEAGVPTP